MNKSGSGDPGLDTLWRWLGKGQLGFKKRVLCFKAQESHLCFAASRSVMSNSQQSHELYNPPGSSVHGILQVRLLSGLPFPSPGDLPDAGIEARCPALQATCALILQCRSSEKGMQVGKTVMSSVSCLERKALIFEARKIEFRWYESRQSFWVLHCSAEQKLYSNTALRRCKVLLSVLQKQEGSLKFSKSNVHPCLSQFYTNRTQPIFQ